MGEVDDARAIDRLRVQYEAEWTPETAVALLERLIGQLPVSLQDWGRQELRQLDAQFRQYRVDDVSTFHFEDLLAADAETDGIASAEPANDRATTTPSPREVRRGLLDCPTFAGLSDEAASALQALWCPVQFGAGETLLEEQRQAEGLYLVLTGTVEVRIGYAGRQRVLDRCRGGTVLGEMSLMTGNPCTATVVTQTEVTALRLAIHDYHQLCRRHPEIEMALSQLVSDRLGGRQLDALHGKQLGGYRLQQCVGRGGMGVVYRAQRVGDPDAGDVAVKMLRHRFMYDADAIEHFRREGELLKGLRHRHLVSIIERFVAFRTRFLVMEFCEGEDLSQYLSRRGPLPEAEVQSILGQVAEGLAYVHEQQILHLDLKPANLLRLADGTVKISDFGLCRLLDSEPSLVVRGTPAYMSPEQLSGTGVNPQSDWYALACVGYELMTGNRPFRSGKLLQTTLEKSCFSPETAWPRWPGSPGFRETLAAALHPEADARQVDVARWRSWSGKLEEKPEKRRT